MWLIAGILFVVIVVGLVLVALHMTAAARYTLSNVVLFSQVVLMIMTILPIEIHLHHFSGM